MLKVVSLFSVCGATGWLFVTPAHADTTIGGDRLAGHGYIWDHTSGVPEPPHIEASSYVIADLETGHVLAAKDPHGLYRPASTLKTLTAITLIPRLDPQKKIRPSQAAVNASGSAVGLDVKLSYTVDQLFHGLLMQSGNDAAIALAEAGGGMQQTLAAMNAEAKRIQANDTVARTPNGLDDDPPLTLEQQHSSAYDLALIMKQGLTLPDFRKYVAARTYQWPALPTKEEREKGRKTGGWEIGTHDHLLVGNQYAGMIGGKNGWTSHALGSFVGAATRGGHTIVISLMHAQSDFWPDARALLDWGFAEREKATPVGTLVDPIPPPAPPKPKTVHRPAARARTEPAGGLAWWKIGLPAGAAVAVMAGLAVGLRRRRRPAAEGPPPYGPAESPAGTPPYTAGTIADEPKARRRPPGDVKVAGAPLTPGGTKRPASWDTAPNPARQPEPTDTGPWTVRLPDGAAPGKPAPGPAAEPAADPPSRTERGPVKPAGEPAESRRREDGQAGHGSTGEGDTERGGEAARS